MAVSPDGNGGGAYFDSLALPMPEELKERYESLVRNKRVYQQPWAKTCAHHCISFLYHHLVMGISLDGYCRILDKQNDPDLFVIKIVKYLKE
jgi:hypothetical protein